MQIKRLKLLGFKSFVDPTELVIEPGLTGVVGPNGCGKSNLLEALRWVMGETSYKSMRASSMEDVIFSGTDHRPSRNSAQVTMVLDNSKRTAPAEFNDHEEIEITRNIEIDSGSSYRVNGRDVRARDVKLLFEDAATGARSHALVKQGQIGEIVNSKPQARRRILEDAAGIAGLHSRRHEAEMRLTGAETNLERLNDLMGQLSTQVNSLKRQARQAKKYKELSTEIRKSEALQHFLNWAVFCKTVEREETRLRETLGAVAQSTTAESAAIRAHAEAAENIKPIRDEEARCAASLQRLKIEEETLDREEQAAAQRKVELAAQLGQLENDIKRERERTTEAREILATLNLEEQHLQQQLSRAGVEEDDATEARDQGKTDLEKIEKEYSSLTESLAELKAEHRKYSETIAEQQKLTEDLKTQLTSVNSEISTLTQSNLQKATLLNSHDNIASLSSRSTELEKQTIDAEHDARSKRAMAEQARDQYDAAKLNLRQISTEVQTLNKILQVEKNPDCPPVLDDMKVDTGFETALGAALGEDLEASTNPNAPASWRGTKTDTNFSPLPTGAQPLIDLVAAPKQIHHRLAHIGLVDAADGPRLQNQLAPGQRLVSKEGDLWRWDGFTAHADAPLPATIRLVEKNRLTSLRKTERSATKKLSVIEQSFSRQKHEHLEAEANAANLRTNWRTTLAELATAKEQLAESERAARQTNEKLAALTEAGLRVGGSLEAAAERHSTAQHRLAALTPVDATQTNLNQTRQTLTENRAGLYKVENALAQIQQRTATTRSRLKAIVSEREQWNRRQNNSDEQVKSLTIRLDEATTARGKIDARPAEINANRQKLLGALTASEETRSAAADQLANAENTLTTRDQELRAIQAKLTEARENKARTEAHLEAARERRQDQSRLIRENLECSPEECLALAELDEDAELPALLDVERKLNASKSERDRLGGVNLRAEEELAEINTQFDGVESERVDLEDAIVKLRTGISQLNAEGRKRLITAFEEVNSHFKKLFSTLFGGGTAELQLIDSDDPLEAGLELLACPPGKKPNVLSLLSGGEQALTAMSLIFAVFLTNPSPICVLDEVDAPLDDANVDRYCNIIEEMARLTDTRFLIITHHPATMARMSRLFGVTMAERGVSQLVSVDLQTAEQYLEAS